MTISTPTRTKRSELSRDDGKSHPCRRMSEREFLAWVDAKTRAEWVDGEVIVMPAVSNEHDDIQWWLRSVFHHLVEHNDLGRVKGPEFAVRLPRGRQRRLPDVMFVAKLREGIIRQNHVEGPPDVIVEIVSPDSLVRDCATNIWPTSAAACSSTGSSTRQMSGSRPMGS